MTVEHNLATPVAFVGGLGLSLAGMPAAHALGHRLRLVVQPRLFGCSEHAVSYLGGSALALSLATLAAVAVLVHEPLLRQVGGLFVGGLVLLGFGLADDARRRDGGLSPWLRLGAEAAVAAGVWFAGVRGEPTGIAAVDLALTTFFLVAATNAFNLLDNMDGIAGSTAVGISASLVVLAAISGQYLVAALAAAVAGATVGFLRHNFVHARLYLGNGGSLFLGFLLAAVTLKLRLPLEPPMSFVAAIAVLAVPATDTAVVIASRLLARRPVLTGGTDHLSHRLVQLRFSTQGAAFTHLVAAMVAGAGVATAVLTKEVAWLPATVGAFGVVWAGMLWMDVYGEQEVQSALAFRDKPEGASVGGRI